MTAVYIFAVQAEPETAKISKDSAPRMFAVSDVRADPAIRRLPQFCFRLAFGICRIVLAPRLVNFDV